MNRVVSHTMDLSVGKKLHPSLHGEKPPGKKTSRIQYIPEKIPHGKNPPS